MFSSSSKEWRRCVWVIEKLHLRVVAMAMQTHDGQCSAEEGGTHRTPSRFTLDASRPRYHIPRRAVIAAALQYCVVYGSTGRSPHSCLLWCASGHCWHCTDVNTDTGIACLRRLLSHGGVPTLSPIHSGVLCLSPYHMVECRPYYPSTRRNTIPYYHTATYH